MENNLSKREVLQELWDLKKSLPRKYNAIVRYLEDTKKLKEKQVLSAVIDDINKENLTEYKISIKILNRILNFLYNLEEETIDKYDEIQKHLNGGKK